VSALKLISNADGTLTLRRDRYIETIDLREKSPFERYEAIRWAALTAGVQLDEDHLAELVWRAAQQ
jgi:hypothetical protein